ncbi:hypothetical protein HS088_TW03G00132 [Tripterygium wilfordii]|uniref:C2 domain-containing protein n=1 Tax=Tripterygium wilfordii TaxID=458696 RepID=A0A7J7DU15_TRIWF|nr:uncharacterized protein LOC119995482 [Tripterygium wilfordii]KAF5749807.1 hypothetical protein HS088_TW03G00132 [Tripterygium wilfordii]
MDAPQSLRCELRIVQARNLEFKSNGTLFVRYYLSSGNGQRIRLNSQELSTKSDHLVWNESFSLECIGTQESIDHLRQETVVFELRWRNTVPVLGRIGSSQVIARAEIPWKDVLESPKMAIENWVVMKSRKKSCVVEGLKPPALLVGMKVEVPTMVEMEKKSKRNNGIMKKLENNHHEYCGCKGACFDNDHYDVFALVAALDAL